MAWSASAASAESPYVPAFLVGSIFERHAQKSGIDALLLYSIAMAESGATKSKGYAAPHPLAIRASNKAYYPANKKEAESILNSLLGEGKRNIDVGLMQVNIRWHGSKVQSPVDLLDADTNLAVASQILLTAMRSSPGDIAVAIGRYHNWKDLERAQRYSQRVLRLYKAINGRIFATTGNTYAQP